MKGSTLGAICFGLGLALWLALSIMFGPVSEGGGAVTAVLALGFVVCLSERFSRK